MRKDSALWHLLIWVGALIAIVLAISLLFPVVETIKENRVLKSAVEKPGYFRLRYYCILTFEGQPPVEVTERGLCKHYRIGQIYPVEIRYREGLGFRWIETSVDQ